MSFNKASILKTIADLKRLDPDRKGFGAESHKYQLNETAVPETIEDFENRHRISLPADYRMFLQEIGNGGAGPGYGLFSLEFYDGRSIGELSTPFPHRESWNMSKDWFRNLPDPYAKCREKLPATITKAREKLKWYRDHRDEAVFQEYAELRAWYGSSQHINGSIPISHSGCKIYILLIVSGANKGEIWVDDRASDYGIHTLTDENQNRHTFTSWYNAWLEKSIQTSQAIDQ